MSEGSSVSEQDESSEQRYCIGKATRYQPMDIIHQSPFMGLVRNRYSELRSGIYDTVEQAEVAAKEATQYNRVGFVVVQLRPKSEK